MPPRPEKVLIRPDGRRTVVPFHRRELKGDTFLGLLKGVGLTAEFQNL
ncbi:hypothetical protein [Thermus tenuipuniceus]|nr:hypothetical protein [Thermus tenuipuniceus]